MRLSMKPCPVRTVDNASDYPSRAAATMKRHPHQIPCRRARCRPLLGGIACFFVLWTGLMVSAAPAVALSLSVSAYTPQPATVSYHHAALQAAKAQRTTPVDSIRLDVTAVDVAAQEGVDHADTSETGTHVAEALTAPSRGTRGTATPPSQVTAPLYCLLKVYRI